MTRNTAYQYAEKKIEEARRLGATELNLSFMGFDELPETLSELTQLRTLHMEGNLLDPLPKWLSRLSSLQILNMSYGQITSLPEWLSDFVELENLNLFGN